MTLDRYLFDVQLVLHGEGRMRRHVGTIDLLVVGRLADGRWLWVWLSEVPDVDDTYLVRDARYADRSPQEGWI